MPKRKGVPSHLSDIRYRSNPKEVHYKRSGGKRRDLVTEGNYCGCMGAGELCQVLITEYNAWPGISTKEAASGRVRLRGGAATLLGTV